MSGPNSLVHADQLMDALVAGRKSFAVLSKVLVLLLQTLLQDEIALVLSYLFFIDFDQKKTIIFLFFNI